MTRRVITVIALVGVVVPLAEFGVLAQTPAAKVSGTVFDQVGGLLPYVAVRLTHRRSMAHHEARTDQIGHFEIEGLTAGDYVVEVERSEFAKLQDGVTLAAGEHLQHDVTGTFEERITVTDHDAARPAEVHDARGDLRVVGTCEISAIGGDVRPPIRIREVHPEYPARLRESGIKRSVVLAGRVTTDGLLKDLRVLSAAHGELAAASMAALHQWRWTAPHLNCVPVEASITVTVGFAPQP